MLWYAAPLLSRTQGLTIPSRLRYMLVLMAAIPLFLAAVHLLGMGPLLIAAAILCALRFRFARQSILEYNPWDALAVAIVFLTASVYIPRAPTDGDSLAYHLPNAIAWAQAGSLDPTWMRYWWYPGGSEISIAGIIASGGLWITGVPSLLAAMMLTSRIGMWLRSLDVPAWTAAAMSAALITITTAAFQTYDQRNDLYGCVVRRELMDAAERFMERRAPDCDACAYQALRLGVCAAGDRLHAQTTRTRGFRSACIVDRARRSTRAARADLDRIDKRDWHVVDDRSRKSASVVDCTREIDCRAGAGRGLLFRRSNVYPVGTWQGTLDCDRGNERARAVLAHAVRLRKRHPATRFGLVAAVRSSLACARDVVPSPLGRRFPSRLPFLRRAARSRASPGCCIS